MISHHSNVIILLGCLGLQTCLAVKIGLDHEIYLEVFYDTSTQVHANTRHQLNMSVAHGYNSSLALKRTPYTAAYAGEDISPSTELKNASGIEIQQVDGYNSSLALEETPYRVAYAEEEIYPNNSTELENTSGIEIQSADGYNSSLAFEEAPYRVAYAEEDIYPNNSTELENTTGIEIKPVDGYNSSLALKKTSYTADYAEEDMEPHFLPRIDPDLLKSLIKALRAAYNDTKGPLIESKSDIELLEDMLEEFEELDLDHDGLISQQEFRRASKFTAEELEEIMEADADGDSEMDFTEFAKSKTRREADYFTTSTIDRDRLELLMKEFKTHDRDNDGSLSQTEYRQVRLVVNGGTSFDSNINDITEQVAEGDLDFIDVVQLMQASL